MTSLKSSNELKRESIEVTPAQKELLELLAHKEVHGYLESLKMVHYLGTYNVKSDAAELWASCSVHGLIECIQKIAVEDLLYQSKN
jgi:hypothetical protein